MVVTEGIAGYYSYHLSHADDTCRAPCAAHERCGLAGEQEG